MSGLTGDEATKPSEARAKRSLRALWAVLKSPSPRHSIAVLVVLGGIGGVLFWGAFNWAMELTNTETFCISCHEMRDYVFEEYKETIHYNNRTGVRATCPDCHVPKEWIHKFLRKISATNELFHKILGSIDTLEKFEDKRKRLAENVWRQMKATDSRECRNCHELDFMDFTKQERRSQRRHEEALDQSKTCIDCHKGIAHELPAGM